MRKKNVFALNLPMLLNLKQGIFQSDEKDRERQAFFKIHNFVSLKQNANREARQPSIIDSVINSLSVTSHQRHPSLALLPSFFNFLSPALICIQHVLLLLSQLARSRPKLSPTKLFLHNNVVACFYLRFGAHDSDVFIAGRLRTIHQCLNFSHTILQSSITRLCRAVSRPITSNTARLRHRRPQRFQSADKLKGGRLSFSANIPFGAKHRAGRGSWSQKVRTFSPARTLEGEFPIRTHPLLGSQLISIALEREREKNAVVEF